MEKGLVDDLLVSGVTYELFKDAGKVFWGKNLKSMSLISKVVNPHYLPSKEDIFRTRIPVDNFLIFTKIDPPEVLEYYLKSCNKEGIDPLVDPFNLLDTCPDAYGKRKEYARGEGSYGPQKKNVAVFLDENDVSLSECKKAMILKDTSGIIQQLSKAYDAPTPGKSSTPHTLFLSDSNIYESILPTPSKSYNTPPTPNPIP